MPQKSHCDQKRFGWIILRALPFHGPVSQAKPCSALDGRTNHSLQVETAFKKNSGLARRIRSWFGIGTSAPGSVSALCISWTFFRRFRHFCHKRRQGRIDRIFLRSHKLSRFVECKPRRLLFTTATFQHCNQ